MDSTRDDVRRRSDSRVQSWGSPEDRLALHRLAEDIRNRSGFGVCAIEVLRQDGMLEFGAIVGSPDGAAELLGRASDLALMQDAIDSPRRHGAFRWVPREDMSADFQAHMAEEGWVPPIVDSGSRGQWYAEDMLLAVLRDERGELRGLLYLDEPRDGLRPSEEHLEDLAVRLDTELGAVVTTIDREALAHAARVGRSAREVIRSTAAEDGLYPLLEIAHRHLSEGMAADQLAICLYGEPTTTAEAIGLPWELDRALVEAGYRTWAAQRVMVIERDAVWGDDELSPDLRAGFCSFVAERDLGALVMIPVGTASEALGGIVLTRASRWMDSEDAAALDVGHDLGRAVTLARAFERENQLVAELQRLDRYRTQLIRTISHELKNPMQVISGHLELLHMLESLPAEAFRSLAMIERGADRVTALATSLLELSQLDQSAEPPVQEPVALDRVLQDVVDFLDVLATQHEVTVEVGVDEGKSDVLGDAEELRRCLVNLVSNAVKYSRPGGRVEVTVRRELEDVVVTCVDEGIGMSAADQRQVFTEFFRSDNGEVRRRPGTGLGLSIAHRIVLRHRGMITVESTLGQGTTFRVRLPAVKQAPTPA